MIVTGPLPDVGARRTVAVERTGALAADGQAPLWACEQYDGRLWQLVGMAGSQRECREFLRGG
jgi:hypothetical protein